MEISVNLIRYRHCERGASRKRHWETGKTESSEEPESGYFQLFSDYSQRSIEISAHKNLTTRRQWRFSIRKANRFMLYGRRFWKHKSSDR